MLLLGGQGFPNSLGFDGHNRGNSLAKRMNSFIEDAVNLQEGRENDSTNRSVAANGIRKVTPSR